MTDIAQQAFFSELEKIATSDAQRLKTQRAMRHALNRFAKAQGIDPKEAMLVAGGASYLHGLRDDINDIDFFHPGLKDFVKKKQGRFEMDGGPASDLPDEVKQWQMIGGMRVQTPEAMLAFYKRLNRPKDQEKIKFLSELLEKKAGVQLWGRAAPTPPAGVQAKKSWLDTLLGRTAPTPSEEAQKLLDQVRGAVNVNDPARASARAQLDALKQESLLRRSGNTVAASKAMDEDPRIAEIRKRFAQGNGIPTASPVGVPTASPVGVPTARPVGAVGVPTASPVEIRKIGSVEYRGATFPGYNKPVPSNRKGKKKMVLVKRGDKVKLVHFGQKGYQDFTQHKDPERRKNYLARSGGIRGKGGKLTANDPFSANYWARKELW